MRDYILIEARKSFVVLSLFLALLGGEYPVRDRIEEPHHRCIACIYASYFAPMCVRIWISMDT